MKEFEEKRIIVTGPTCSGKNTWINDHRSTSNCRFGVPITSRPRRGGEVDGKDYKFVTEQSFLRLIRENELKDYTIFAGEYHGIEVSEWLSCEILQMEAGGINRLDADDREDSYVIYLDVPIHERIRRMKTRGWEDKKVVSRLISDSLSFTDFTNYNQLVKYY